MKSIFAIASAVLIVSAVPALAANARNPYANVDRRNDAGNDTGDSQVDRLNSMQLNQNYYNNRQPPAPPPPAGYPPPGYGR